MLTIASQHSRVPTWAPGSRHRQPSVAARGRVVREVAGGPGQVAEFTTDPARVPGDLAVVRANELRAAADALGVGKVTLLDHPDAGLTTVPDAELAGRVVAAAEQTDAVGLLVFDPSGVTGHPDHRQASRAALQAAAEVGLPVLGWTLPIEVAQVLNADYGAAFAGHPASGIDLAVTVDRTRQLVAVRHHPSQAVPGSVRWRRLELLGDREHLRWLHTTHRPRAGVFGPGRSETLSPGRAASRWLIVGRAGMPHRRRRRP
jgi:LmbE family N-acetylglucosaminyl deacetylase